MTLCLCSNANTHHGAKNSTSMRGSFHTDSSKFLAVKLMTSESRSAKTREARARIEADVVREQNRIMVRDKEETNYQWIYRLLNN